jgi:hypothetical protein
MKSTLGPLVRIYPNTWLYGKAKRCDFGVDSTLKKVVDETLEDTIEGNTGNECVILATVNDNISVDINDVADGSFLNTSPKKSLLMSKEEAPQLVWMLASPTPIKSETSPMTVETNRRCEVGNC